MIRYFKCSDSGTDIVELDNTWLLDTVGAQKQESDQIQKDKEELEEKEYSRTTGFKSLKY